MGANPRAMRDNSRGDNYSWICRDCEIGENGSDSGSGSCSYIGRVKQESQSREGSWPRRWLNWIVSA